LSCMTITDDVSCLHGVQARCLGKFDASLFRSRQRRSAALREEEKPKRAKPTNAELIWLCEVLYADDFVLPKELESRGWALDELLLDDSMGLKAGVFKAADYRVVAVRGTKHTVKENLMDDIHLIRGVEPKLVQPLVDALQRTLRSDIADEHLFVTGHSLGAAAVNWAMLSVALEKPEKLRKIGSIALFENPGIAAKFLKAVPEDVVDAVSAKTIEIFGAPNVINMLLSHMQCKKIRVMLPHGQKCDAYHVGRCTLYSTCRTLPLVGSAIVLSGTGLAAAAAGVIGATVPIAAPTVPGAVSGAACSVAPVVPGASLVTGGFALGLSDYASWCWEQHHHRNLRKSFNIDEDMPRDFRRMRQWPSCFAVSHAARSILTSALPRQSVNNGFHTMTDPDSVIEARLKTLTDYVEESDAEEGGVSRHGGA